LEHVAHAGYEEFGAQGIARSLGFAGKTVMERHWPFLWRIGKMKDWRMRICKIKVTNLSCQSSTKI
jgi:hypothetical protein